MGRGCAGHARSNPRAQDRLLTSPAYGWHNTFGFACLEMRRGFGGIRRSVAFANRKSVGESETVRLAIARAEESRAGHRSRCGCLPSTVRLVGCCPAKGLSTDRHPAFLCRCFMT
jgi:hypothetical protein